MNTKLISPWTWILFAVLNQQGISGKKNLLGLSFCSLLGASECSDLVLWIGFGVALRGMVLGEKCRTFSKKSKTISNFHIVKLIFFFWICFLVKDSFFGWRKKIVPGRESKKVKNLLGTQCNSAKAERISLLEAPLFPSQTTYIPVSSSLETLICLLQDEKNSWFLYENKHHHFLDCYMDGSL